MYRKKVEDENDFLSCHKW